MKKIVCLCFTTLFLFAACSPSATHSDSVNERLNITEEAYVLDSFVVDSSVLNEDGTINFEEVVFPIQEMMRYNTIHATVPYIESTFEAFFDRADAVVIALVGDVHSIKAQRINLGDEYNEYYVDGPTQMFTKLYIVDVFQGNLQAGESVLLAQTGYVDENNIDVRAVGMAPLLRQDMVQLLFLREGGDMDDMPVLFVIGVCMGQIPFHPTGEIFLGHLMDIELSDESGGREGGTTEILPYPDEVLEAGMFYYEDAVVFLHEVAEELARR